MADLVRVEKRVVMSGGGSQVPYRETASALDMSESAIKSAVQRLRKRLGQFLRTEIAETVANPADVDNEVRHLLATVRS